MGIGNNTVVIFGAIVGIGKNTSAPRSIWVRVIPNFVIMLPKCFFFCNTNLLHAELPNWVEQENNGCLPALYRPTIILS